MSNNALPTLTVGDHNTAQSGHHSLSQLQRDSALVLIMEDDNDCLLVTTYTLELLGYRCIATQNAQDVMSLAMQHQPDLFLLDIAMPVFDGIEVFHQLRIKPEFRRIPIIAVTALAMDRERDQILAAGFDDFLSKPFFLQDLARLMHRHLPMSNTADLEKHLQVFESHSGLDCVTLDSAEQIH